MTRSNRASRWYAILVFILTTVGSAACTAVDRNSPHERARTLASELMSPFCHGLLLSDCPSPYAADLRAEIEQRLVSGETPRHITNDLVQRYGADIRGNPPAEGIGLLFWTALVFSAAVSLVLVVYAMRRSSQRRSAEGRCTIDRPFARTRELSARLDEELFELE